MVTKSAPQYFAIGSHRQSDTENFRFVKKSKVLQRKFIFNYFSIRTLSLFLFPHSPHILETSRMVKILIRLLRKTSSIFFYSCRVTKIHSEKNFCVDVSRVENEKNR